MCKKEIKCRAWVSLDSLGVAGSGCLRDAAWINSLVVPTNQSILNPALYIDMPSQHLTYTNNVAHGKFGFIDSAIYEKAGQPLCEVYVKRPIMSGKSLLYEACIQKLVRDSLAAVGFPTGAPRLHTIFKLRDNSVCFAMEQLHGAMTLDRFIESSPKSEITTIVIECLLQLCAMVWHLDTYLGINHRDLKPSNFLIVENPTPIRRVLVIENEILEIQSKYTLTLIDFGFSCIGSTETHISDVSLSNVYSKSDPCPKDGRDMFLFIALLYIDFFTKLPPKLVSLFESWLPGANICSFIRKDKESAKKWIYFMAGNEKIRRFDCCPCRIVRDLQQLT
jgi:serine/threonine protein kinase